MLSPLFTALPRLLTDFPSYLEVTSFPSFVTNFQAITHSHLNTLLYVQSALVGVATGYLILRKPRLPLGGRFLETGLWFTSLCSVVCIWVWHNFTFLEQNVIHDPRQVQAWFVYSKLVWSLFLGLTTYLCCTGRLNWLNSALNQRWLRPVAKLSACVYALRSLVIFYRKTSARQVKEMQDYFDSVTIDSDNRYFFEQMINEFLFVSLSLPH